MRKILSRIWQLALTSNINTVITIPIVLGFLFLFGSLKIGRLVFEESPSEFRLSLTNLGTLVIVGFSGLFQIIRKEGLGILGGTSKGLWPVALGWFWVILTWGGALYALVYIVSLIVKNHYIDQ